MNITFPECLIFQTWRCSFCWNSNSNFSMFTFNHCQLTTLLHSLIYY